MKKHIIYKIVNLINGKEYIGKHSTFDIRDNYMGSGKILKFAKDKYGMDNFIKEILFVFDNEEEMNNKEIELLSEDYLVRKDTYNIKPGGNGGCGKRTKESIEKFKVTWSLKPQSEKDIINLNRNLKLINLTRTPEQKENISKAKKGKSWDEIYGVEKSQELKKQASERNKGKSFFEGKSHTEESKLKMRDSTTGFKHSEETKKKMKKAKEGYIPTHRIGSNITEEHKKRISLSLKNRTKEERQKIAKKMFKKVKILNEKGELVEEFESIKSFKEYCIKNGLPTVRLRESYENDGKIIKSLRNKKMKKYIGWSAVKVD